MTQLRKEEENLQADIATTAEYLAERDGAALLQEKYHQKLETLENLLESWEQGRKELEEKQGAYQREIKKRDALRETYQAMESLFLDAQAGILAEKLTEGEPCPVCGAIHHRSLPDEQNIRQIKKRWITRKKNFGCRRKRLRDKARLRAAAADR